MSCTTSVYNNTPENKTVVFQRFLDGTWVDKHTQRLKPKSKSQSVPWTCMEWHNVCIKSNADEMICKSKDAPLKPGRHITYKVSKITGEGRIKAIHYITPEPPQGWRSSGLSKEMEHFEWPIPPEGGTPPPVKVETINEFDRFERRNEKGNPALLPSWEQNPNIKVRPPGEATKRPIMEMFFRYIDPTSYVIALAFFYLGLIVLMKSYSVRSPEMRECLMHG